MQFDIADNIRRHGVKRLLLAVSGGLDSICLAHYFIENQKILGIEWLGIAHVHHGLREGTADRDAAFVEEFARKFNVPFFLKRLDGEALKTADGSLEENARDARYKALVEVAMSVERSAASHELSAVSNTTHFATLEACKADRAHDGSYRSQSSLQDDSFHTTSPIVQSEATSKAQSAELTPNTCIVTAHHAGDQSETMYMRLRRGTTLEGLRGIQELRAISREQSVVSNEPSVMSDEMHNVTLEACKANRAHDDSFHTTSPIAQSKATSKAQSAELTPHNMPPFVLSPLPTAYNLLPTVPLYRPFLNITRAELLTYAHEHNLKWCEDESNADVKFARNKIRHVFLPHLEENVPDATKQLCRIASLADKAYEKILAKCDTLFSVALKYSAASNEPSAVSDEHILGGEAATLKAQSEATSKALRAEHIAHNTPSLVSSLSSFVSINKKKLNKILLAHKEADLSEMFRLWLSTKGFRFPIGFFYSKNEPAHIKIPVRAVYRRRSILKIRHTVWICEFKDTESAAKFVS